MSNVWCRLFILLAGLGLASCSRNAHHEESSKMLPYIASSQEDPQQFGQHILEQEMTVAAIEQDMQKAAGELKTLQQKKAEAAVIKAAQDKLTDMQAKYSALQEEVKVMLAVVGLNNPE